MSEPELVELKEQQYKDARTKEDFDRFHERTRTREPDFIYEVVRILTSLMAWVFFRVSSTHAERVPAVGPVILAPNHFSFLDHFFLGSALRRKVHFMAKSQLFKPPMPFIYTHGGVFPVRRGVADEDAFTTALAVLERGDTMAMYAEGGRSRTGEPAKKAKRGIGRLALPVRRADRPDRDRRLQPRAQLEARPVPEDPRVLRRAVRLRARRGADARPGAGRRRRHLRRGARALRGGDQTGLGRS